MQEWWSYSLSDFLLFSPRTYYRLIERHNLAVWPGQILTLGLGVTMAALLRRPTPRRSRAALALLALLWVWVGWAFVARRYAAINWVATYAAWLFGLQAVLLGWLGAAGGRMRFGWKGDAAGLTGGALFAGSLALYPLLAPAVGRGWTQAEIFGIAPDPTVLGTLGLLLNVEGSPRSRWALLAAPAAWCLLSGATLLAMGSPEAWILLAATFLVLALSLAPGRPAA
jgi:hypothetical protein